MKKELFAACSGVIFAASMVAQSVQATESYTAKVNDDGKFCAKVEVRGPAGLPQKKMKCRTIAEWEAAGYKVSTKEE